MTIITRMMVRMERRGKKRMMMIMAILSNRISMMRKSMIFIDEVYDVDIGGGGGE